MFTRLSPRLRTWGSGFELGYRIPETANEVRRCAWFGLEEVHGDGMIARRGRSIRVCLRRCATLTESPGAISNSFKARLPVSVGHISKSHG